MEEIDLIKPLENINIAEVCRACFETCEQYKILFDEAECIDKRTLGDVFFDVVKIEMKANAETPPSRICLTCSNDLITAYNFIQKSQKNNLRLHQYLQNANIKKPDCLTEFPIDIPNDQNITNFLQIKVENEAIHDYDYNDSIADDDRNSPGINYDSDESDYEPLINKKEKIKKLECTYCNRIFKRQDFFENHMKKHKDEVVNKKEVEEESEDEANRKCEECDFSCDSKLEMKKHTKSDHSKTSFPKELNSAVKLESEMNECAIFKERPSSSKELFISKAAKHKEALIEDDSLSCPLSKEAKKTKLTTSKITSNFVAEKEKNMGGGGEATEAKDNMSTKICGQSSKRMAYQKILFDQKKSLVRLYDEGKTIKEAAAMTNINLNTAKGILRNYKKRRDLIDKRRGGNRSRKLTNEVLTTIEACVEKHPGTHLEDIRKILAEQKVHVSKSTIRNGLRQLKITLNLPSYDVDNVNMPQTIERRRIFALEFSNWDLHERHKIIFIDECVFSLQWEKVQKTTTSNYIQGRKAVVIAALNSNGIIHSNILGKGSCNTTEFAAFIRELVEKISTQEELTGAILIMDSAGIHVSREVGEILAASKFCTRTLPPFSQMLNPLAKSFVKMKAYARSLLNDSNIAQSNLVEVMETSVEKITPTDCSNYVMDVVLLLHDAIAGRAFQCAN